MLTACFASFCLVGSEDTRIHGVCESYSSLPNAFHEFGIKYMLESTTIGVNVSIRLLRMNEVCGKVKCS